VRFGAEEHAQQAVEQFHGREVGGRALRLDIAEDRPRAPRQRRDFGGPPGRGRNDFGGGPPPSEPGREGYGRDDFARDRGDYDRGGDDRGGRSSFDKPKRPKGSRRGLRGKKRSL
jgi:hypothetical protein